MNTRCHLGKYHSEISSDGSSKHNIDDSCLLAGDTVSLLEWLTVMEGIVIPSTSGVKWPKKEEYITSAQSTSHLIHYMDIQNNNLGLSSQV